MHIEPRPTAPSDDARIGSAAASSDRLGSPSTRLFQLATSYLVSRALHVIAELGVADRLADETADIEELAAGAIPDRLHRLLRLLAAHGVFELTDNGLFRHTELSRLLRRDHPLSMRDLILVLDGRGRWRAVAEMKHTVLTGETGMRRAFGSELFDYYGMNPDESADFDRAMRAKARADIAALLAAYDFSDAGTVVDVGGGSGHLLSAIVERTDGHGVIFELPSVASALRASRPTQFEIVAGDFFRDPLPSGDTYLLMNVLHDWDDAQAERILSAVRRAAQPGAKVLVIELPLPEHALPHPALSLDVLMMILTGGRERTISQYRALIAASGLRPSKVVPTAGPLSILQGIVT